MNPMTSPAQGHSTSSVSLQPDTTRVSVKAVCRMCHVEADKIKPNQLPVPSYLSVQNCSTNNLRKMKSPWEAWPALGRKAAMVLLNLFSNGNE